MPRIRTIKPDWFSDSKTGTLSDRATKLFLGLLIHADDVGVVEYDLLALRAKIFPYIDEKAADVIVPSMMNELMPKGIVVGFSHDGRAYLWIKNFLKHQRIDHPGAPLIKGFTPALAERAPTEPEDMFGSFLDRSENPREDSKNVRGTFAPEGKGREGKGKETEVAPRPEGPTEPPAAVFTFPVVGRERLWGVPAAKLDEYAAAYPGVNARQEAAKALQWCRDNPARRKTAKGMPAFLNRWMEKAQNDGGRAGPGGAAAAIGALCPLCARHRLEKNAVVCAACGPTCRRCGNQTPDLVIIKRPDGTVTAWGRKCCKK